MAEENKTWRQPWTLGGSKMSDKFRTWRRPWTMMGLISDGGDDPGEGGGSQGGEMTADGAEIYMIVQGMCMRFEEMAVVMQGGTDADLYKAFTLNRTLVRDEPPFIGITGYAVNSMPNYFLVTNDGDIFMRNSTSWESYADSEIPTHGWIEKDELYALDPNDEANMGLYAVRTVRYPMIDGTLTDFTSELEVIATRFEYYFLLNSVNLPNATIIGENTFRSCQSLINVSMPNVKGIGKYAFNGCDSIANITLPSSLVCIDKYAFADCTSLETIVFDGTIEQWSAVQRNDYWNDKVPATHVQCTDGTVAI